MAEKETIHKLFKKAEQEEITSLFVTVAAMPDGGKTHFALTAPGDIFFVNIDKGLKGVLNKFVAQKNIYVMNVDLPKPDISVDFIERETKHGSGDKKTIAQPKVAVNEDTVKATQHSWNNMIAKSRIAMADPAIRTISIDTGTAMWELERFARFGTTMQIPSNAYGPVNLEMSAFIDELKESGKNIIVTHKMRQVYVNDKPTTMYEPAQFTGMNYLSDVCIELSYKGNEEFGCLVTKCKPNISLEGQELPHEFCTFEMLATLIVPDSDPENWI